MRPYLLCLWLLFGCGNPTGEATASGSNVVDVSAPAAPSAAPKAIEPPFAVRGDCSGLMLTWFDGEGVHTAQARADVPEDRRRHVRVASLSADPAHLPPPDVVFVADLREPSGDGYRVVAMPRAGFDALVDAATAAARPAGGDVVLYSASWCGACRATRSFFEQRGVAFVEKDIEKDAGANAEMQRKAKAAGKTPRGVPVIDFDGEIILGFDQAGLERLIAKRGA